MEKAQILKNIGAIGRASKKLTTDIQTCAVACAVHAVKHGDVTLADQLVDAVGKAVRRASLRAWFERQGPFYLPKGKDKFAYDSDKAKALRELSDAELTETLDALKWEEAKPEEPVVSVVDIDQAFDRFMKRIESQIKDAAVTVKNRELLEQLAQTAAAYHAEQVLNKRATVDDKAEAAE
jgi:hypothetical protein